MASRGHCKHAGLGTMTRTKSDDMKGEIKQRGVTRLSRRGEEEQKERRAWAEKKGQ